MSAHGTNPKIHQLIHHGVVTASHEGYITVNIASDKSDCSGCAIASMCTQAEEVTIPYHGDGSVLIGHNVTIAASQRLHRHAVIMFLVVPIVLLISVLIIALWLKSTESTACVISMCSVAVWYLALWALRSRIRAKAAFRLMPDTEPDRYNPDD